MSLGYGPDGKRIRRKVLGKTKQEVRDRLKALRCAALRCAALREELNAGVRSSSTYTVREAVDDWLREGLMLFSRWPVTSCAGLRRVPARRREPA